MKNQIQILIGLLFLSNLKMKDTHLASLVRCLRHRSVMYKAAISRAYSTSTDTSSTLAASSLVKKYKNAYLEKKQILEDNKDKAGVYR